MPDSKLKTPLPDEEILDLLFARDENALREIDGKYGRRLLTLAGRFLSDERNREEVLSDTYLKVWNTIPPYRPASLPAYLLTLMRRGAIDCYRKNNRQKTLPPEGLAPLEELENVLADQSDPLRILSSQELGQRINAYLRTVSDRQQYIFISRYYLSRPIDEISRLLGVSRSTVEKELTALRRGLREALRKEGYTV
ncbi:MAG: sigma-70 family RNA polymerase sigma factor [Lachnospiraceae bacterium]|nr:sigma-70 family RNA polymerase sigma factor [Lachnospiraceae bacterium]